jgi:hypothetical protein
VGGRSERRGPKERVRHPQGRNGVEEPGAARLAGNAGGPSRECRPFPRSGKGRKQRRRYSGDRTRPAAQPHNKGGTPSGADGSAVSNRASSVGRQMSSAPKPGAPPGCEAGVPRGRDQAPHPVRLKPAACVLSPAPFQAVFVGPRQRSKPSGRDPQGLGRSAQRAIERGRAKREAPAKVSTAIRADLVV